MATIEQVTRAAYQGRFDDQMSAGADAAAASMRKLGTAVVETDDKVTRATRSADSWLRSADPMTAAAQRVTRAQQQQAAAQKALNSDLAAGGERQAAAERALAALAVRVQKAREDLEALEKANAGAGAAISGVGNSARLTARELQQLSPQIADVGVTLAGGMNPLMILIQQGPQMADAVGGIGRAFTLLRAAAFSTIGATVAVGASIAAVTIIAEGQARAMADLSNRLRVTRDDYEALAQTTENAARRVAATTSLGTGDARIAGSTIAGARNFTGGEAELTSLIALSGRLARVMGTDAATAAGKLAEALDRPRQAAEALAASGLRTMDEGLVRTIRSLENQGRVAEAARLTIDAYNRAIGEVAKTPLQRATEELSNAFTRLWQQLQPVVVAIGTVLVQGITLVVQGITSLVSGISQLATYLRDTNVARFLFGDVQPPAAASSASGETPLQRQLRLAREANPRFLQQRDNREQAGATRDALAGATGDDARLLRSRLQELNEAYRGMQGPVADYIKGLDEQARATMFAEGAARELYQAELAARNAGGDAAAQALARSLVQERLNRELAQATENIARQTRGEEALTAAYGESIQAGKDMEAGIRATTEALRYGAEGSDEYNQAVASLTTAYIRLQTAQEGRLAQQTLRSQEQQLELIQRETDLVGASVVVRERELAVLRERQRIMATGEAAPAADDPRLVNAARIAEGTQALQRQQSAFQEIQRVGEQAFDRIGSAITTAFANGTLETLKFSNVVRAAASEMAQAFIRLSVLNPIKNQMGGNAPTLSLGGFGGTMGGPGAASTAGSMQGGINQAGQAFGLRSAGSYGNLGQAFTGQGLANTGFGFVDSALNAPIYGTGAAFQGPTLSGAPLAGVDGLTVAGGLGGVAGIAGGAYGIYSGIQKGGIGGAAQVGSGILSAGASAAMLAGLGSIGPAGWAAIAALAIAGALLPGEKASGKGQSAWENVDTGETGSAGLGGKRFSAANLESSKSATGVIANLAREVGSALGGAVFGSHVGVGTTSSRGDGPGRLYLDVAGRKADFANDEAGSKALAEQAGRFILQQYRENNRAQGDYAGILNASGDSLETLQKNLEFYDGTYKKLGEITESTSAFGQQLAALVEPFDAAIAKAQELSLSTERLTQVREREVQKLQEQRDAAAATLMDRLTGREVAAGIGSGDLNAITKQIEARAAARAAAEEIASLKQQMVDLGFTTDEVSAAVERLTNVQAAELAMKQRASQEDIAARQAAAGNAVSVITSLRDYVASLRTTQAGGGTAMDRLDASQRRFNAVFGAAQAGDANSIAGLQASAEAYRVAASEVFGSGEGFADALRLIEQRISAIGNLGPDTLTASFFAENARENTDRVIDSQGDLKAEVKALRTSIELLLARPA